MVLPIITAKKILAAKVIINILTMELTNSGIAESTSPLSAVITNIQFVPCIGE
ncbi:hypothetical protein SDC9_79891 [bioreactor metagenome]|uniref:Uncharacterized protein n=1 Tax=bioreactor metagenome TaxID=1076179 RepID=A0A644YZ49_9ZZZZ